jgi:hypothetical protein
MRNSKTTILGGIVAVILLISGIAWASGVGESSSETLPTDSSLAVDDSSSSSIDDNGSSTSLADDSTSTSVDDSTSSTIDDDDSTTSTTIDDNTSSTIDDDDDNDSTTSTTIDDNTTSTIDDDDDNDEGGSIADGARSFSVDGVAVVTVNVVSGQLQLIGVNLESGWNSTVEKEESDRIEIEFNNGEREAEFEIRLDDGRLRVEAEVKD